MCREIPSAKPLESKHVTWMKHGTGVSQPGGPTSLTPWDRIGISSLEVVRAAETRKRRKTKRRPRAPFRQPCIGIRISSSGTGSVPYNPAAILRACTAVSKAVRACMPWLFVALKRGCSRCGSWPFDDTAERHGVDDDLRRRRALEKVDSQVLQEVVLLVREDVPHERSRCGWRRSLRHRSSGSSRTLDCSALPSRPRRRPCWPLWKSADGHAAAVLGEHALRGRGEALTARRSEPEPVPAAATALGVAELDFLVQPVGDRRLLDVP